jgi:hypothetical protein
MPISTGQTPSRPPPWAIVITEWALDSYLNLLHAGTFTKAEYKNVIRPDVVLLREGIPSPYPKFRQSVFWGPAKFGQNVLPAGYKMKWRQIGNGKVQLRLPVTTIGASRSAHLCFAYEKANTSVDQRMMARFKTHMNLISQGRYVHRGYL